MNTIRISTLLDKEAKFIGYDYFNHPIKTGWFINITLYQVNDDYIICLSECQTKISMSSELGSIVPGETLIPYVQRCIQGCSYDEFCNIINQLFPRIIWLI